MNGKSLIWWGMIIGSTVIGALPFFWGGGLLDYTVWGGIGGILGIWMGFRLAKATGAL